MGGGGVAGRCSDWRLCCSTGGTSNVANDIETGREVSCHLTSAHMSPGKTKDTLQRLPAGLGTPLGHTRRAGGGKLSLC